MKTNKEIRTSNALLLQQQAGGQTGMMERTGKVQAQISAITRTKNPKLIGDDLARQLEIIFEKEIGWMDHDHENSSIEQGVVSINFKSMVVHGGIDSTEIELDEDEDLKPLFFRTDWISKKGFKPECLVARQVKGSSMEPSLWDGDTIVINTDQTEPRNGRVFLLAIDGSPCVKRLRRQQDGSWRITSDNPAHSATDAPLENVQQIAGEVVHKMSDAI